MKQTCQKRLCALVFKLQCRIIKHINDVMKRKKKYREKRTGKWKQTLEGRFWENKSPQTLRYIEHAKKRLFIIFKYISENQEIYIKWIR